MSPGVKKLEGPPTSPFRQKIDSGIEKAVNFFNGRNTREKVMIIILGAALVIFFDYWVLIHPVVNVFRNTLPDLAALESELKSYRDDQNNKGRIEKEWLGSKKETSEKERSFVAPDELPSLLENLSKVALESGVKILSLKTGESEESGNTHRYARVPIHISAVAGTHELGAFLSRLESGQTFFKVLDLKIKAQGPSEPKRHIVDAVLQVYRRSS